MTQKKAAETAATLCDEFGDMVKAAGGGDLADPLKTRMRLAVEAALLTPVDNAVEHKKEEARIATAEDARDARLVKKGKKPLWKSRVD